MKCGQIRRNGPITLGSAQELQSGLNFSDKLPELFEGKEMGEDAWRVFDQCLMLRNDILKEVTVELPQVRESVKWAQHLPKG